MEELVIGDVYAGSDEVDCFQIAVKRRIGVKWDGQDGRKVGGDLRRRLSGRRV